MSAVKNVTRNIMENTGNLDMVTYLARSHSLAALPLHRLQLTTQKNQESKQIAALLMTENNVMIAMAQFLLLNNDVMKPR